MPQSLVPFVLYIVVPVVVSFILTLVLPRWRAVSNSRLYQRVFGIERRLGLYLLLGLFLVPLPEAHGGSPTAGLIAFGLAILGLIIGGGLLRRGIKWAWSDEEGGDILRGAIAVAIGLGLVLFAGRDIITNNRIGNAVGNLGLGELERFSPGAPSD